MLKKLIAFLILILEGFPNSLLKSHYRENERAINFI